MNIADEEYRAIRERLVVFFRVNGRSDPESLADEAIFRAVRRFNQGVEFQADLLPAYCLGIARNVLLESFKEHKFETMPPDVPEPGAGKLSRVEQIILLHDCLHSLNPDDRRLWLQYHLSDRHELARVRNQTPNALRIQIHRITRAILRSLRTKPQQGNEI